MLVSLVSLATPVGAAIRTNETIILVRDAQTLAEVSWSSSGAFTDSGTWTSDRRVFGGLPSPNVLVVGQLLSTHTGSAGTFGLRFEGLSNATTGGAFTGTWQVIPQSGTGAYVGLQGQGTWVNANNGVTSTFTLTGRVQYG
jgi:uncharacterized protein DUF3224